MGTFSNGTEGELYQSQYCFNCIHWIDLGDDEIPGCPIWDAHILYSYGAKGEVKDILNLLIPLEDNRVFNAQCAMFTADKSVQKDLHQLEIWNEDMNEDQAEAL